MKTKLIEELLQDEERQLLQSTVMKRGAILKRSMGNKLEPGNELKCVQ